MYGRDRDGDEADGYDETLIPLDYMNAGQIKDDDLLRTLVIPMKRGVFVTSVMDCCHSGTVLDLPYVFKADGEHDQMEHDEGYDFDPMMSILGDAGMIGTGIAVAAAVADSECCTIS